MNKSILFKEIRRIFIFILLAGTIIFGILGCVATENYVESRTQADLVLMGTSDIHHHLTDYDYFQDRETENYGIARTSAIISRIRAENQNTMLFDNGDTIQGNPMGDYIARVKGVEEEIHPVFDIFNYLSYDAMNLGNHEFNYGLEFLSDSIAYANFPIVSTNLYHADKKTHWAEPYVIIDKEIIDTEGNLHTIKVGVMGFVPPNILLWDKNHLEGNVHVKDIIESAQEYAPILDKEADIVIAIPHSGMGSTTGNPDSDNRTYELAKIKGIDAIFFGHSHVTFPDPNSDYYSDNPNINNEKGTIFGVAAVEPNFWGSHLGLINLRIGESDQGGWVVLDSNSEAIPIYDKDNRTHLVDAREDVLERLETVHDETINYIRQEVGQTTSRIHSFFALVRDDPSVQIVNNAQKWYIEKYIQGTEYEIYPVLSAAAPFKAGGRGGAEYYTDIPVGSLAIKNIADLYVYPNTVQAVLLNGAQIQEWLEFSASIFNTIDPNSNERQQLINDSFRSYNFDIIDGLTYEIDVSVDARYNRSGELQGNTHRIINLSFEGNPIVDEQMFIVATNNYRAAGSGGNSPKATGLDGSTIIIQSPDENRQAIINYIIEQGSIDPSADNNWSFKSIDTVSDVYYYSSPLAEPLAESVEEVDYVGTGPEGFAEYKVNF